MSDNRTTDMFVAFGIGALVGAVGALLLAPASGEETRRRIGEFAGDAGRKTKEGAERATDFVKGQKERIAHAIEEGKQAYRTETVKS